MVRTADTFPRTAAAGVDVSAKVSLSFKGGDKMRRVLRQMNTGLNTAKGVSVGFLASERYPSTHGIRGTPRSPVLVAQNAFWQEFGNKYVPERPFFRTMIADKSPQWGESMAYLAKAHNYDARKILSNMGLGIQAQLRGSIREWSDPPNAHRTIDIKGFNNPLIDEGIMLRSVSYEVTTRL